jgi:ABC-2 type transport system permease protein
MVVGLFQRAHRISARPVVTKASSPATMSEEASRKDGAVASVALVTSLASHIRARLVGLRKYYNIFRVSLIERMAFRGDFFLGSVLRFLPMVTTILLWNAVYDDRGGRSSSLGSGARTYNADEIIAYLLLVHISRMFSSMPGLATGVAGEIRDGSLKKYLLQPLDMIGYLVAYRVAHKAAYITMSALPYALLFFLCSGYFHGLPDAATWAAYVLALVLSFLVGFFFECCIGMSGFWFLEITSFVWIINTVTFFLSGHMFPLDLLSPALVEVSGYLPFQYLAYFPAAVFLGKIQGPDLVRGLLVELAWALTLVVLSRLLYLRGLRRYSAYGG